MIYEEIIKHMLAANAKKKPEMDDFESLEQYIEVLVDWKFAWLLEPVIGRMLSIEEALKK